jgi:3-isopropylmalate/(R)-2-methylmalate dehydratase small subunit
LVACQQAACTQSRTASFGDIFYGNSFKKSLFPVRLPVSVVNALAKRLMADAKPNNHMVTVDLEACTVHGPDPDGPTISFEIDPQRREALLEGLDEIGMTLKYKAQIAAFQAHDAVQRPWIYSNMISP